MPTSCRRVGDASPGRRKLSSCIRQRLPQLSAGSEAFKITHGYVVAAVSLNRNCDTRAISHASFVMVAASASAGATASANVRNGAVRLKRKRLFCAQLQLCMHGSAYERLPLSQGG